MHINYMFTEKVRVWYDNRSRSSRLLQLGHVFAMLWTEEVGDSHITGYTQCSRFSVGWFRGERYSQIRRFVIVHADSERHLIYAW